MTEACSCSCPAASAGAFGGIWTCSGFCSTGPFAVFFSSSSSSGSRTPWMMRTTAGAVYRPVSRWLEENTGRSKHKGKGASNLPGAGPRSRTAAAAAPAPWARRPGRLAAAGRTTGLEVPGSDVPGGHREA